MVYLLGAVLMSAAIPNIFRLAQLKDCRQARILLFNYITCISIAWIGLLIKAKSIFYSMSGEQTKSALLAAVIGIVCGVLYYFGFYFYQKAVRISGAAMASAFGKMGIIIPVALSAVVWREYPGVLAIFGVLLALLAVFLCYFDFKTFDFKKLHSVLIIFFFIGGLGDFTNKIFQKYCLEEHELIFLAFVFTSALFFSLKPALREKKPRVKEMLLGVMLGVPNMLTVFFLIRALYTLPAYIVFPMFSGGTIVIALILSLIFYKDIPSKRQFAAIFIIAGAMVMLNI